MTDVLTLLTRCRALGAEFTPTPAGTLKITAPAPLPDELWDALKLHKAEVLALLTHPHITTTGELIIPCTSDPKYHYWQPEGQRLAQTLAELNASPDVWRRYVAGYTGEEVQP